MSLRGEEDGFFGHSVASCLQVCVHALVSKIERVLRGGRRPIGAVQPFLFSFTESGLPQRVTSLCPHHVCGVLTWLLC